jgi:hypothetical protein
VNVPLLPLTFSWLGMSCLVAGLLLVRPDVLPAVVRLGGTYNRSRFGRRLALKLEAACIDLRPAQWRAAQVIVSLPAILASGVIFASPWAGVSAGTGGVRVAGRIVLRLRRGCRDRALGEGAAHLARRLGTELAASSTPAGCLRALHADGAASPAQVHDIVAGAVARLTLGAPPVEALDDAMTERAEGAITPGISAMQRVATYFALEAHGGSDGSSLRRLADSFDADRRVHATARTTTAELRLASIAVPLLTAVVVAMLGAGDQAMLAAAFTGPEAMVLVACAVVACAGVMAVRRLTVA